MMPEVDGKVAALEHMSSAALREAWKRVTGTPAPRISPAMTRLALAWEIQARALGGMPRPLRTRLDQMAAGKSQTLTARAGTRLVREWNGVAHVVVVNEEGVIRWDERSWRSLSEVARAITGTRWSGPAFFGLKKKMAP